MPGVDASITTAVVFDRGGLDALIAALKAKGFHVVGPRVADDAVVYADLDAASDLPAGWGDEQEGGRYRLTRRKDGALFGYTSGVQGWKRHLYPPRQKLFAARRDGQGFAILPPDPPAAPLALIGVRACELAAIAKQAKVFGDRDFADPGYQGRLASAFVVAVECGEAGGTCFCAAMGTGPAVETGFDIKMVEVIDKARHVFVATAGSAAGAKVLDGLKAPAAAEADKAAAAARVAKAAKQAKTLDAKAAARLKEHPDHARWDDVARRCMTCGNCTMVCPTCFCTTVEDTTDLKGEHAERWRNWDSCFTIDFSYIHGGAIRTEVKSRYRQWITHKLSTWHDQFGSSGCVGCGRCITWCPVGIDITAEATAITEGARKAAAGGSKKAATSGGKGR
ncbi:MAG: 4Fe-4S dicluster domain-containing protein [Magnetospirillum sp.]|nr:4Fe-4S dicluster domain-containing protein [Magnetospirillum sp.]